MQIHLPDYYTPATLNTITDCVKRIALVPQIRHYTIAMNERRRPEMLSYTQELVPALCQLALMLPIAPAVPAPPLPEIALIAEVDDVQMFTSDTIVRRDLLERTYCCYQGMVTLKRLLHDEWFRVVLMDEAQRLELSSYIPTAIAHLQYIEEELVRF